MSVEIALQQRCQKGRSFDAVVVRARLFSLPPTAIWWPVYCQGDSVKQI